MSNKEETKIRVKHTNAMIKKLPKKNHRYYELDSESIGLRVHVELNGAKSFHLQRYVPKYKYSKRSKLGDFPDMSITEARKLAAKVKAANVQGKDPLLTKAALRKEKKLGDVVEEFKKKKLDIRTNKSRDKKNIDDELGQIGAYIEGVSKRPDIIKVWKKYSEEINIKSKRLSEITSEDIFDYHGAISSKTTYSANRMVRLVRKIYNYAIAKGYFTG